MYSSNTAYGKLPMLPSWCQIPGPTSNLPPKAAHHIFQQIFTPPNPPQAIFPHTPRNLRGLLRRQKQRLWEVSGVFSVTTTTRKRRVGVHTSRSGGLQSLCPLLFTVLSPKVDKRFPPNISDVLYHPLTFFWVPPWVSLRLGSLRLTVVSQT